MWFFVLLTITIGQKEFFARLGQKGTMDIIQRRGCRGGWALTNGVELPKELACSRWRQRAGFGAASRSSEGFCCFCNWFSSIFVMFPTQENEHDWYIAVLNCSYQEQEYIKKNHWDTKSIVSDYAFLFVTLQQLEKTTSKHSAMPLCTSAHPWISRSGSW